MTENSKDEELIMVVTNPEGKVVLAGIPRKITAQECREYMAPGWKIATIPFKEYQEANLEWAFDKL